MSIIYICGLHFNCFKPKVIKQGNFVIFTKWQDNWKNSDILFKYKNPVLVLSFFRFFLLFFFI
jgi:hypothetical protein